MFALPPGPGDEAYGELLRRAHDIGATEMAVFSVGRRFLGGIDLKLVAHVRPDDATREMRAAAVKAFREIIQPCVERRLDRVVEVGGSHGPPQGPQFCLVTLARRDDRVVAAAGFIARFTDVEAAQVGLCRLQSARP